MKNMELEARIKVLEAETKMNEKEKRAIVKMQKEREQYRDKILCFGTLLYVGLFAILIAVIVSKQGVFSVRHVDVVLMEDVHKC